MLGALPGFGKLGAVAVDRTAEAAHGQFRQLVALLDTLGPPGAAAPGTG